MDFMKVFDQTVREIKREVNIKVLKVPEIEQKVLDATNNEPWGPHGSALTEIAQATKKFTECQLIMTTLWTRLGDGGRNWRHVYKALAVLEYLVAHGSERALDDIVEHTFQISSLSGFDHTEPNGKDVGINVRKKAENITSLLSNKDKIQEVRDKAAANRDKYFGLSSTGITYKSSSASTGFGSSNFQQSEQYGGINSKKEGEVFKDSYRDRDRSGGSEVGKDSRAKKQKGYDTEGKDKKKGSSHYRSRSQDVSVSSTSRSPPRSDHSDGNYGTTPFQSLGPDGPEDDFDDFDPRGTSKTEAATANVNQVNLLGDLMDAPLTISPGMTTANENTATEVDLFADAAFVSAPPSVEVGAGFQAQGDVDLFASQPTATSASSPAVDLFATPDSAVQIDTKPSVVPTSTQAADPFASMTRAQSAGPFSSTTSAPAADPFASVPLSSFDGSDLFGDFTSHTDQMSAEPIQNAATEGSPSNMSQKSSDETTQSTKKDPFQVKSGIWADSLSRGLIDLNITAPKKTNLADIGIVGGLGDGSDEKEKGPPAMYMGRAMGAGSGLGRPSSGFNSMSTGTSTSTEIPDDFFSSLGQQQQQYGGVKK